MTIEKEHALALYGIESAIVAVDRSSPDLTDRDVLGALDALLREYEREKRNRGGIMLVPSGRAKPVFERCRLECERQLGRRPGAAGERHPDDAGPAALDIPELLRCLKRLHKSVRLWRKQGGRRGYLDYVSDFIAGGGPTRVL